MKVSKIGVVNIKLEYRIKNKWKRWFILQLLHFLKKKHSSLMIIDIIAILAIGTKDGKEWEMVILVVEE